MSNYIRYCLLLSLVYGAAISVTAQAQDQKQKQRQEILLGTNVASAYAADYTARIEGGSIEHIECILKRMEYPQRIIAMPWRRAYQEVRKQELDGFFTTILLTDVVAEQGALSKPLVLENWYWFWRADMPEPDTWHDRKLGAILGSPQAMWLEQQHYAEPMSANNLPQLLKLLFSKRIDAVLADKEHFERVAKDLGTDNKLFHFRFFRYVPLGAYFSQSLLATEPHFLERFNKNIYSCAPNGFQMATYEREKIQQKIRPWLQSWVNSPELAITVVAQNKKHQTSEFSQLMALDDRWKAEFQQRQPKFSASVIQNNLSQHLRELKQQQPGLITEIIVVDAYGFNVAISDMTSDYWQGDEDKYLQVMNQPKNTLFFDAVRYDESSRRFQVQVSVPLYQSAAEVGESSQSIGVITLGLDIDKALSLEH